MTPPPHRATANSDPQDCVPERIAKRLASWKALGALTGVVLGGAVAFGVWKGGLATKDDVAHVAAAAAGEVAAARLETQALRDRMTSAEVNLAWIKAQLIEIAHATGAKPVPSP